MFDVIDALRGGVDGLADCGYANTPPSRKVIYLSLQTDYTFPRAARLNVATSDVPCLYLLFLGSNATTSGESRNPLYAVREGYPTLLSSPT
jgi:hypothetical protein